MTAYSLPAGNYITTPPPRVTVTMLDNSIVLGRSPGNSSGLLIGAATTVPGDTIECDLTAARALLASGAAAPTDPAAYDAATAAYDALPITPNAENNNATGVVA